MDYILIDIDNNTPGAIINNIIQYLGYCARDKDIYYLSRVNKYFSQIVGKCRIKKFCGQCVCNIHSPNYTLLQEIEGKIRQARAARHEHIHFDSIEKADLASHYIYAFGRCCWGKGLKI